MCAIGCLEPHSAFHQQSQLLPRSVAPRLTGHRRSDLSSRPRIAFVCIVCLCAAVAASGGGWIVIGCGEEVNEVRSSLGL